MPAPTSELTLSPEQRHMYASERLVNFRLISKLVASRSSYVLSENDLAPAPLHLELSTLGQFAELVYSPLPIAFVFDNLPLLLSPGFPLEGYDALKESLFVTSFRGTVADLSAYVAYRPQSRQLVMAISGTSSLLQATYTVRARRLSHTAGEGCEVHSGFWHLYKGLKPQALNALRESLEEHTVDEIVITGHSMGGTMCHLFALDLLTEETDIIPNGTVLKLAAFGAPRCGNWALVQRWHKAIKDYRAEHGEAAIQEYAVKGYNDGMLSTTVTCAANRSRPLYYVHGQLYVIPETESERALFDCNTSVQQIPNHPRGGHNYYNGRDMERASRRMNWVKEMQNKYKGNWEELYRKRVEEERKRIENR
ncbi:alpha/beta-hydrolase [Leucogyrophana mollusca]|uniref:Alpha/beta-hydrolase n=1 Tax=Leucogyrophana mollusca TaxID=85980 RepID=A0ACB8BZS5_9AGAM|nr:alpha/beta-hydrolase [Leucogyrophana mollusca]